MPDAGRPLDLVRVAGTGWSKDMRFSSFSTTAIVAAGIAVAAFSTQTAHGATGTLVGIVTGPGGSGLSGATVTAFGENDAPPIHVVTGQGGEFRFVDIAAGRYDVEGRLYGFFPSTATNVVVANDQPTRVTLSLSAATFSDTVDVRSSTPQNTLEAAEIRESTARDLGEALSLKPDVWKVRKGGIANDVVIRGYQQDDLTVLIDGARVEGACPNRMDPPTFHVDLSEVDRAEVLTATGRLAAQGSLGGLVNVVTKKPGTGLRAGATLMAGSWSAVNPAATVSYGNDNFAVLGGLSFRSSDPYVDGSGVSLVQMANYTAEAEGEDAYRIGTGWARVYFMPGENHVLQFSYARQNAEDILYPGLMMDAAYDDTDRLMFSWLYTPSVDGFHSLRTTVYGTSVNHWMVDTLRTTSTGAPRGWSMGTMATTEIFGATVEARLGEFILGLEGYSRGWNAWTEMAGMDYMRQFSIPDVTMDVYGASVQWIHGFSDRTHLEVAGRIDNYTSTADPEIANTNLYYAYHDVTNTSQTGTLPSLSVGISQILSSEVTLNAGLSRTVRFPDPRELFFGLKKMGADWVGNPVLQSPKSASASFDVTWNTGGTMLRATAWADQLDDYIILYSQDRLNMAPGVMNNRAMSYTNIQAKIIGGSAEASAAVSSRLFFSGSLSYVRGTQDPRAEFGITSSDLVEMPPLSARLAARWQNTKYFIEAEGLAAGRQDRIDQDLNEIDSPGWAILNLKAGIRWSVWRLQLVVGNVFDTTYRLHFSYVRNPYRSGFQVYEPGRNAALTLGWNM